MFSVKSCIWNVIRNLITPQIGLANEVPYSRKYWWELNLAVEPKIAIARILADLNLAVRYGIAICIYRTLAKEGPLRNVGPLPTLGSISCPGLVFTRICTHVYLVAALKNAAQMMGWFMSTELRIAYVRSINNVLNSRKTKPSYIAFMPRFSTNQRSYMDTDRSHAHLIKLHSTIHGEVSRPP